MGTMRKIALAAGAVLLAAATGCGPQTRYVTATYWHSDSAGFVAYTQRPQVEAHVLLCTINADNTPMCRPQPAVDQLLNAPQ